MTSIPWKEVEVPRGTFIGWAKHGQSVTLRVASYSDTGGSDYNNEPCPQLVGALVEPAVTYRERGTVQQRIEAGEFVTINAGQPALARRLRVASAEGTLVPGGLCRVEYVGDYATSKGEGKDFKVYTAPPSHEPVANGPSASDI